VLNGRREHKLHETISGFDAAKSLVHPGDVSDEEYVKRLVEDSVTKFGKLDMLVNNAAIALFGPFAQTTTQDWRKVMATDLDAVYFPTRESLPHLVKTKGPIINISCPVWVETGGSVLTMRQRVPSQTLRAPWRLVRLPRGVRINAVAPLRSVVRLHLLCMGSKCGTVRP
jgi:meso-butanediol dehydrogenase / (S,S)-butanediol dehydrogenase / diacetyl reductase